MNISPPQTALFLSVRTVGTTALLTLVCTKLDASLLSKNKKRFERPSQLRRAELLQTTASLAAKNCRKATL